MAIKHSLFGAIALIAIGSAAYADTATVQSEPVLDAVKPNNQSTQPAFSDTAVPAVKPTVHHGFFSRASATTVSGPVIDKPRSLHSIDALIGSAPSANFTPTQAGFDCFSALLKNDPRRPTIAVGHITDQSGKFSNEATAGGDEVTQGLGTMVYTALGKFQPRLHVIERVDTTVTEADINLMGRVNGLLVSDPSDPGVPLRRNNQVVTNPDGSPVLTEVGIRHFKGGQFPGADYYITGAVTEVNYNISSGGAEASFSGAGGGARTYTMNVVVDLRLVDARSLEVIDTVSEQKVIKGYEVKAGLFNFFGVTLVDINAGKKAQEPIQLGVRSAMELAVLKLVGAIYQNPGQDNYGDTCAVVAEQNFGK